MAQHQRRDDEGPKIHRTEHNKDRFQKHKNLVYDLLDEEDFDDEFDTVDDIDEE